MSCELEFRVGVASCEKKNAKIKLNVWRGMGKLLAFCSEESSSFNTPAYDYCDTSVSAPCSIKFRLLL